MTDRSDDITTVRMPRDLSQRLARLAKYGETKADIISRALDAYESVLAEG